MRKYKLKHRTITIHDVERGIWQFVLDHSTVVGKDRIWVRFVIDGGKEKILNRFFARISGLYKVKNEAELIKEGMREADKLLMLEQKAKMYSKKEARIDKLPKWKRTIIRILREITNKLITRWTLEKPKKK